MLSSAAALETLTRFARVVQTRLALEQLLQSVASTAAALGQTSRASVRLLDPSRSRLLAVARSGEAVHADASYEFRRGEGLLGWVVDAGEPLRSADAERDPRFVQRPDQQQRVGSFLGVPLIAGASCLGVLSATHPTPAHFTQEHEALFVLLAAIAAPHLEVARLARLAQVDPLTGALNRYGFEQLLPETEGDEGAEALSVISVDLDHFKHINDSYGHAVGDEVLRLAVRVLGGVVRASDLVVRMGGEEFLLVLPRLDLAVAARVAERARSTLAASEVLVGQEALRVTLSAGVAQRKPGESRAALLERADKALYQAKREGRDRVRLAP